MMMSTTWPSTRKSESRAGEPAGDAEPITLIAVLVCVLLSLLTVWMLHQVSDRSDEQGSEAPRSPQDVPPEKKTPFLKLQSEIKEASGEQDVETKSELTESSLTEGDNEEDTGGFVTLKIRKTANWISKRIPDPWSWTSSFCFLGSTLLHLTGVYESVYDISTIGPPRKEVKAKGCEMMHDVMGLSCLFLGLPILSFLAVCLTGNVGTYGKTNLALFICLYQIHAAYWSFVGDYHFAARTTEGAPEVKSEVPEQVVDNQKSTKSVPEEPAWWQKMMACNKIDVVFAIGTVIGLSVLCVIQLIWGQDRIVSTWKILTLFGCTITAKLVGSSKYSEYSQTENADTLWYAFFWHTLWHVGGGTLTLIQVYELMSGGFKLPC